MRKEDILYKVTKTKKNTAGKSAHYSHSAILRTTGLHLWDTGDSHDTNDNNTTCEEARVVVVKQPGRTYTLGTDLVRY